MSVLRDPEKLSYVNKDLISIDNDISRYISAFIPTIKGMDISNEGRMILRIIAALIDMLNFSIDMQQRESNLATVAQLTNILRLVKLIGYHKQDAAGSTVDCTFTMLTGAAPPGGQAISLWTRLQKSAQPMENFCTIEAATILEGETSIENVATMQGYPITGEVLTAAASGLANQSYQLISPKVVESQIHIYVNAVEWTKVDDFWDSEPADPHFTVSYDADHVCTILFGDGYFGAIPNGVAITASYLYTDGEGHDVGAEELDTVLGVLSNTVSVTNPIGSSGGDDGDTVDLIKIQAPAYLNTFWRGVTADDIETLAKTVEGIYDAKVYTTVGNIITIYLLPTGGGIVSASKLTEVQEFLTERLVLQGTVVTYSVQSARIRIRAHVTLYDNRRTKASVQDAARQSLINAFEYTEFKPGTGYTISEVGNKILDYSNGLLFKSVDFEILSRWPRVIKSNALAPDMNGDIQITSTVGYNTWVITAVSLTTFYLSKDGVLDTSIGTIGVEFTSDNNEVTFMLGTTTDTFTPGDTWTFKTSKYSGNLFVDENEHMSLDEADLDILLYYPGEYNTTSS